MLMRGEDISYDVVYEDLVKRDNQDMNREVDPLHLVEGAWNLDTTGLSIEQVVDMIVTRVKGGESHAGN
jgi:cytidylate kinase